ncbi:SdpI family protein [Streptococcus sp. CSL10205-OR2]|uniref:SdpI family protein n=1 Tax=Streptococcus sp. CSL10205-OR2 TaxID=2980558 RepID=UPI0021DACE97|nr:SdpI family protein [Streptococcus sp. CSL10205-OR2]MCU9533354.1 SdpI family protein [Streptococcus sp. CSL10205-OR2]
MNTIKKWFKLSLWLYLVPLAVSLYYYPQLPSKIAIHYNVADQPDNFTDKFMALFVSIGFIFMIELFSYFVLSKDPRQNYQNKKLAIFLLLFMPLLSLILIIMMISYALNSCFNVLVILRISLSLLIIIIGNYLPKTKRNNSLGIRLPWTLANDNNWIKTHDFSAKMWVIGGILLLTISLFSLSNELFIALTIIILIAPIVYSFVLNKSNHKI